MYRRFALEGEEMHVSLSCVPLTVRRKLDLAELKISLAGWQTLSREERLALCHLPVDGEGDLDVYREVLKGFAARAGVPLTPLGGGPVSPSDWSADRVQARLKDRLGETFDAARLGALDEEARYALFKLADPKREPDKLRAAVRELGLAS
jgi:hypothetical protein